MSDPYADGWPDAADNGRDCYDLAIATLREIHETAIAVCVDPPQGAVPVAPSIGAAHTRGGE